MSGEGRPGLETVDAAGLTVAIVGTRWHAEITDSLVERAAAAVKACAAADVAHGTRTASTLAMMDSCPAATATRTPASACSFVSERRWSTLSWLRRAGEPSGVVANASYAWSITSSASTARHASATRARVSRANVNPDGFNGDATNTRRGCSRSTAVRRPSTCGRSWPDAGSSSLTRWSAPALGNR